jgi:hypothetical protein
VFISCGQSTPGERKTAADVKRVLKRRRFSTYVATEVHSSRGLAQNIYAHLTSAEYFLFIDFRREAIGLDRRGCYRGSLFSNQELGIASYLESNLLPFLQEDVRREGILDVIQGNPISFKDPGELPDLVRKHIVKEGWDAGHRQELRIETTQTPPGHAWIPAPFFRVIPAGEYVYHELNLRNLHRLTLATNCIIQVVGCRGPSFERRGTLDVIELKFKHITTPVVTLPARSSRHFDAIVVRKDTERGPFAIPGILNPTYIDSESILAQYLMTKPGDYEIDLQVHSREFGTGKETIRFHLGQTWEEAQLSLAPRGPPDFEHRESKRFHHPKLNRTGDQSPP